MPESVLKTQLQAQGEGSRTRKFVVKVERVEIVVLAGEVEQTEHDFGFSARETVTDKRVKLPEVSSRLTGYVAAVVLAIPIGLFLGKETAGRSEERRVGK